ncbi:MAG: carboxypeptidase regulatory-like domain-containing protein [Bryobacterales bacterium]|nr:carboxypeptidase regulatory-like domain-containing protein [Bryobacterales bacterium]MBV9400358.1 carboxypeptidase regulatory-like domain-containing protein [Bryobacterales bacterium]
MGISQTRAVSTRCAYCLCLLVAGIGHAQSTFGDIRGTARDPQGLALPAAMVTLHSLDENTTRTALTDAGGGFFFENLKPGRFEILAEKEGFAKSPAITVELEARQNARVDLALSLAQVQQTINVESAAEQINTENSVIGDTRGTDQLVQMPLNFRAQTTSPLAALALSPNVVTDPLGNIAVAGATFAMTGFSVDGISTADITNNGSLKNAYPSSESLAEMRVTAFNNSAEFAQVADVTFISKSGTNQLHGSLFEYFQNDALDATIFNFSNKAPKRFNTFGGSLGGPVTIPHLYNGRDKTFFFVDYEGNRRRTAVPEQYLVPTQAQRNGDISALPIIDPVSGNPTSVLTDPLSGQPFPNNMIPFTRLNPVSLSLLNRYYPLPNTNAGGSGFNYELLQSTPSNTNGWDARLDQNVTSKQQIYARFSWKNLLTETANPLLPNDLNIEHDRSLIVSYNYAITPRMVNEFRFGFTRSLIDTTFPIQGAVAANSLGLTGMSFANHPATGAFPTFNFSDGSGFTPIGRDKDGPGQSRTVQFTDNLSRTVGNHTFRFGIDARRVFYETVVRWGQSDDFGAFTFNQGVFTGSAYADFLLGAPNTSFIVESSPNTNERAVHWGFYGEDTWQVNSRLTVNFGMRYEINPKFTEDTGDIANFDPRNGGVVVPDVLLNSTIRSSPLLQSNYNAFLVSFNACQLPTRDMTLPCSNVVTASQDHLPQSLAYTYRHDFDPRLSVAFRPFRDNKTVFRAGVGIFTQTMLGPFAYNSIGIPLGAPYTYVNNNGGAPLFQFPQTSPPSPTAQYGGTGFYDAMDPYFKDPQTAQWNVTVERQLTNYTAVRVSYAGMNSYRMGITEDYNAIPPGAQPYVASPYVDPRAPYQNWVQIYYSKNAGFANYQGLTLEATHRLSHGFSFQANYTWAHNISNAQGDAPSGFVPETLLFTPIADQFNTREARGNVAGTPRQRFLLTGTFQLPFGPGRNWHTNSKFADAVLGGWNVNTVTLLQTGPWLTPTISPTADQSNTNIVGRGGITLRPDAVGNPASPGPGLQWNIDAFAPTPANAGRIGNAGVGVLEGPGTISVSAGLAKTFQIKERLRFRFESTFTNVLNHTNFAPPASNISNPSTFGALQSTQAAGQGGNRVGQLALRMDF